MMKEPMAITLTAINLDEALLAPLRTLLTSEDPTATLQSIAALDDLADVLTLDDRLAVRLENVDALQRALAHRESPEPLRIFAITPAGIRRDIALEPIGNLAVTYLSEDELTSLLH
jgi:hypothetical protein